MIKMKKVILSMALLVFLGASAGAGLFADTQTDSLKEGIRYHDLARTNPDGNIEKGKALLAPLQKDNPLARAYYGSLITLEAGVYAKNKQGIKALFLISEGTKLIDDAVNKAPDLEDIRFLRMENSWELSQDSPIKRYKEMKIDIDWLDVRASQFDAKNRGVLDLYEGFYYLKAHKAAQAQDSFAACVSISPDSPEAVEANKQLERLSQ
jgi:hypothetical protein